MTSYHDPWTPPVYLEASRFDQETQRKVREILGRGQIQAKAVPGWEEARRQPKRPSHEEIQRKVANFKLVADALELLLQITPEIPGASVTLTPAHHDELKRIILALPAVVAL